MARLRTPPKAVQEIKRNDPDAHISPELVRRWIKQGKIKRIPNGAHSLVDLDELERFISGGSYANC